ncbi:MAG: NYN domain-containing protein [Erysipelotrichaceae bacterium]|jgi:ribosomal protection tetracycline resistance protein
MKNISLSILAHVDAGKTTLNECLLFHGGIIRKMGRVDHQDAFLDFDRMEKERGITIYSKMANFKYKETSFYLVDTPGHNDFSSEMERSLQVADVAVLVVSGLDGVESHTVTIFNLLKYYDIPTFIFVNKMDIALKSKRQLLEEIQKELSENCFDFSDDDLNENIALASEKTLLEYEKSGEISRKTIVEKILERIIFPVYFGSALKNEGVDKLLEGLNKYTAKKVYPQQLGLKFFKVSYHEDGTRICYCKVTGGRLNVKDKINQKDKVDQIRLYNGQKYELIQSAEAGMIVGLKGLNTVMAYDVIGTGESKKPALNSYMTYRVSFPEETDTNYLLKQLHMLSQEDPAIKINYHQKLKELSLSLMGKIQIEVIENTIFERTGIRIKLQEGSVLFKETIAREITGYGHFEPLKHYAEVHLKLEPLERGKGLEFNSAVSTDMLSSNWQSLIINHLKEKQHLGVLTGSAITDIRITLINGRGKLKHTESGDFKEASCRAVRQGLKMAESILLEPYYNFRINVKSEYLSKVLYDLETIGADFTVEQVGLDLMLIAGSGPIRKMQNYQDRLLSLTSATAEVLLSLKGYDCCAEQDEIVKETGYDSETDIDNPTGSIFCSHGAGFYVPDDYVSQYLHIKPQKDNDFEETYSSTTRSTITDEELKRVVATASGKNKKDKKMIRRKRVDDSESFSKTKIVAKIKKPYLLIVDGYNLMHSYRDNSASFNFDGARDRVISDVASYAGYRNFKALIVFDAYKTDELITRKFKSDTVEIVYTKANQTADAYIEKKVHQNKNEFDIIVVSSDSAVQNMVLGDGAIRKSSREFMLELQQLNKKAKKYLK